MQNIINKINNISDSLPLKEQLLSINDILLFEFLNINNYYNYSGNKGLYFYQDENDITYFVRMVFYDDTIPYFEIKTGWLDKDNNPIYNPIAPKNISKEKSNLNKKSNTIAKIYKDELLPFFDSQNIANKIVFNPISESRKRFCKILINKFTDPQKYKIDLENLIIEK